MRFLLNAALFYGGWFACVFGMGAGIPALAPLAAAAVVAVHLAPHPARRAEAWVVIVVTLIGPLLETAVAWLSAARFAEPLLFGIYAPPGVLATWAVFATTFDASLGWLSSRLWVAGALALVGAPLSYAAAARVDAVELSDGWVIPVAGVWGIGLPAVLWIASEVRRRATPEAQASEA